jgi:hypothetical protein
MNRWWVLYDLTRNWVRYPRRCFADLKHWLTRPLIGDKIEDCRYQTHRVVGYAGTEDDLILDDGSHCSWMHCGDHLPK